MAFQIALNNTSSEIIREYREGIKFSKPYEVCLKSFVTYNNIPNISPKHFNNEFILINLNNNMHKITIPTASYELKNIINFIETSDDFRGSNISLRLNKNTFRLVIHSDWQIDLSTTNSVGKTLGFSPRKIGPFGIGFSDKPIEIFTINTVRVKCNLIKANIHDLNRNDNTLYEFPLSGEVGEKIIERPQTLIYYPVITDEIYDLVVTIVDQDGELVDFRGEHITVTLGFRPTA